MRQVDSAISRSLLLVLALLLSLSPLNNVKPALADPGKLAWSIVDTPAADNATNVIASPSEINAIAIGSDDKTFYAVDIPNNRVYKSTNGGVTWTDGLSRNISAAGANLPAWNIAVAPDDVNFVVAVTDNGTGAPREVFVSKDGGANWEDANFPSPAPPLAVNEFISCVDVSMEYGDGKRDIAVGTRDGVGTGTVYVHKVPGFGWVDQTVAPSIGWTAGDVVALKFSPTYTSDLSLAAISSTLATGTFLNLGTRDIDANTTTWNTSVNYPVLIVDTNFADISPNATQIITADLELPSDFSGSDPGSFRRYYVSTDATAPAPGVQIGVYRIDNAEVYRIRPPMASPADRISSLAYYGTYEGGELLAGEVTTDGTRGVVNVWRTSTPIANTPSWLKSDALKSPTGGGNSGYANAQVAWSPDGSRAYCATSSDNLSAGGTGWAVGQWPRALTTSVALDESAFSVSPYAPAYEQLLDIARKSKDSDIGNIWNQLSLIDTTINQLSDVAVLEAPQTTEESEYYDYSVLYLASENNTAPNFGSIWRSTSDPLGQTWERVLCTANRNIGLPPLKDMILRINPRITEKGDRSQAIVFADLNTNYAGYSPDEGQFWQVLTPGFNVAVTDLTLASDEVMYILNNALVRKGSKSGTSWKWQSDVDTYLDSGHTIDTPLKNPEKESDDDKEDWVIVGDAGPPVGQGMVAYADFSKASPKFEPPVNRRIAVRPPGNMHVIADDKFEQNKTIYAASHDLTDASGKIYRWVIDESTDWEELEPPNTAFYGLAMRNDVLYGAWRTAEIPEIIAYTAGVDRTLFPRDRVPPPPEWDYLTAGLPSPPNSVLFTREPSSLKIASNDYNNLWAIDNNLYSWLPTKAGCLWAYTDIVAKAGPWTTSPASGDFIPVDPVSGRAKEIDFRWRQLSYVSVYELQLAKDSEFSIRVLVSDNITPVDQLAPACFFPSGGLVPTPASEIANWGNLECGHTYYWRVRARGSITGDIIRSPWSATMYFIVEAGLPARTKQLGPALLGPVNGARGVSPSPAFSWSPMPGTTRYEFILAKDAALTQVIVKAKVPTTAYKYDGQLEWNATHFWQVRALEPIASEPSPVASFTVIAKKAPMAPHASPPSVSPLWVWVGIAIIYVALVVAIVVLIKRRYVYDDTGATDNGLSLMISRTKAVLSDIKDAIIARIRGNGY